MRTVINKIWSLPVKIALILNIFAVALFISSVYSAIPLAIAATWLFFGFDFSIFRPITALFLVLGLSAVIFGNLGLGSRLLNYGLFFALVLLLGAWRDITS